MRSITRLFPALAGLFGVALLTGLIAYYRFPVVGQAVASSGWGMLLVVCTRAAVLAGAGLGWAALIWPVYRRAGPCILVRFVREAINCLLPVAQVGGDLIGARLLTFFRVSGGLALASVLVDIWVQVATLVLFVLAGTGLALLLTSERDLITDVLYGLALAVPAIGGLFLTLRVGGSSALMARLTAFAHDRQWGVLTHAADLGGQLRGLWARPKCLAAAMAIHAAVWFLGAVEVFVALHYLGHPGSFAEAVVVESIGQGARAAAFAIPGGLGVQDAGLVAAGALFGVPAQAALAVALLKRLAEVALGVPGLLAWQALEGRKLFGRLR